ncbi:MAG: DUF116 domain-containing protein [Deltaproteobacteria bacterium]|nr:DUF116 domain-containing protein [Deltaproteobacteria bacterium]
MQGNSEKWEGSPESIAYRPGIGVYLTVLAAAAVVIGFVGFFLWYIPTIGLRNIHPALPYVLGAFLFGACALLFGGAAFVAGMAIKGRVPFYSKWLRWLLVKIYLPVMVMAGGILKIPKIRIERAFIEINNQMVRLMGRKFRTEKLLILMPHCIQFDECKIKVTRNVRNCAGCGKCEIGDLLSLSDEFGVNLFISTGGTVARRKVSEERPDAVIAVACERDLTSGLQDSYPLPVMALINKRPRGYCMETGVAIEEVRQAIRDLCTK